MTNHYEQSKVYAENGEYARAQTFALLAIADRLENVGGALIHLIPINEDGSFDWLGQHHRRPGRGATATTTSTPSTTEEFCDGPEDLIREISDVVEAVKFYRQQAKDQAEAALEREKAARDDILMHEMEAAYLRAGLKRLLESSLSVIGPLTITQRRHVQSVLDHTWTPA